MENKNKRELAEGIVEFLRTEIVPYSIKKQNFSQEWVDDIKTKFTKFFSEAGKDFTDDDAVDFVYEKLGGKKAEVKEEE